VRGLFEFSKGIIVCLFSSGDTRMSQPQGGGGAVT
jgi:hypothetical protein